MTRLRLLIADDESIIRLDLREMLTEMGHEVVAELADGTQVLAVAREKKPDLAILDIKMPGRDGIEAARDLLEARICPVVLLTAYDHPELVHRAQEAGVYGYLTKPFRESDIGPALAIARARFDELEAVRQQVSTLEEALETRKLVDRAKALLMEQGMSERDAFRRIQHQAMNTRRPMREIAQAIVLAFDTARLPTQPEGH